MSIDVIKYKTKEIWDKNEKKIKKYVKGTFYVLVLIGGTLLIVDNVKKGKVIKKMGEVINAQNQHIKNLEIRDAEKTLLCIEKDNYHKSLISNLLRQGNSEGGREMAYRREWLKYNNV